MLRKYSQNSFSKKFGFLFDNILPKLRGLFFVVGSFFIAIGCNFPFNQFLIDPFSLMTLVNLKRLIPVYFPVKLTDLCANKS